MSCVTCMLTLLYLNYAVVINAITDLETWDPDRWPNASEDDVTRDLSNDISNSPTCLHIVELVAVETELFLPTGY